MPGIVGIISPADASRCRVQLAAMMSAMRHRPDYVTGSFSYPELGVYAGWLAHPDTQAAKISGEAHDGQVALAFCGETHGASAAAGGGYSGRPFDAAAELLGRCRRHGSAFPGLLNGLFSGLLVDRARAESYLFCDRFASERLYVHQDRSALYFASEAKALLEVLPQTRAFDESGVRDLLNYGCVLDGRTLFQGVRILPGGTIWRLNKRELGEPKRYFVPADWESLPPLSGGEFESALADTLQSVVPSYFAGGGPIGVAITGGLDTRMIMACAQTAPERVLCYTFDGQDARTLDASVGARVAISRGLEHHTLALRTDFLADFAGLVDRTVFVTDGTAGATTAHEIYFNRLARGLAPIRVTGNYGSEVLRGMSVFRSLGLSRSFLAPDFLPPAQGTDERARESHHPTTSAAFREVPWLLYGSLAAGRSELTVRTPYLDHRVVELAYRAPAGARASNAASLGVVRRLAPDLARIATDRGIRPDHPGLPSVPRRALEALAFKLDYMWSEGLPSGLLWAEPLMRGFAGGLIGRHKYLPYRRWFQHELSDYVHDVLHGMRARALPFWRPDALVSMADQHRSGTYNRLREINAVLTLEAVDRLLLSPSAHGRGEGRPAAVGIVPVPPGDRHRPPGFRDSRKGTEPRPARDTAVAILTGCHDRSYALGLSRALAERGVAVDFIGSDTVHVRELAEDPLVKFLNLRGDQSEDAGLAVKGLRLARYYLRLMRYAGVASPPVLHVLWNNKVEWFDRTLLMLFYKACGRRIVLTAHNVNAAKRDSRDGWFNRATLRVQYALADHIFVHTANMHAELCSDFGVSGEKATVIPFGINDTTPRRGISRATARAMIGVSPGAQVGLFFGQIAPYKGLHQLVDALPSVMRALPGFVLVIAGKVKRGHEVYWAAIRARIEQAEFRSRVVQRIEHVPDDDVEAYLEASDVVLLPYVDISQSGVPFLSFSFGVPVVATDVGELREDVIDGKTGLVCAPGSPEALSKAVTDFFGGRLYGDREATRAEIRQHALERHSWARVAEITTGVYRRLHARPAIEHRMSGPSA